MADHGFLRASTRRRLRADQATGRRHGRRHGRSVARVRRARDAPLTHQVVAMTRGRGTELVEGIARLLASFPSMQLGRDGDALRRIVTRSANRGASRARCSA